MVSSFEEMPFVKFPNLRVVIRWDLCDIWILVSQTCMDLQLALVKNRNNGGSGCLLKKCIYQFHVHATQTM